jgi:hypothetical protein
MNVPYEIIKLEEELEKVKELKKLCSKKTEIRRSC